MAGEVSGFLQRALDSRAEDVMEALDEIQGCVKRARECWLARDVACLTLALNELTDRKLLCRLKVADYQRQVERCERDGGAAVQAWRVPDGRMLAANDHTLEDDDV